MKRHGIAAAAFLMACSGLFADSVSMSFTSFAFNSGQTIPVAGVAGTPFWNNYSPDIGTGGSNAMNIGYLLTDTGGFTSTTSVLGGDSVAGMLVGAGGSDPAAFNFTANGDPYTIEVLFSATGLPGDITMGWYNVSTPSILNPIFSNVGETSAPLPPPTAFSGGTSGSQYGFYATMCYNPPTCTVTATYYTQSADGTTASLGTVTPFGTIGDPTAFNHFALFNLNSNPGNYVLAFSEAPNGGGTEQFGDFQDFVVELQDTAAASVPEPATLAIVGLGLVTLGIVRRRSRR